MTSRVKARCHFLRAPERVTLRHVTTQGQRVKELAAAAGITPAELARRAGIDSSAMVNIVGDHVGLGPTRAKRIADALGLDVSDVLLPKAEAVTLASVVRRIESLETQVAESIRLTRRALALLGDQQEPAASRVLDQQTGTDG